MVISLRQALQNFEKKGLVDYSLGGHICSRSPSVQQGKEDDCFQIQPDPSNALAWKPNNVAAKNLKAANIASAFPWPALANSALEIVTSSCLLLVFVFLLRLLHFVI